jgi:hypothetical protein
LLENNQAVEVASQVCYHRKVFNMALNSFALLCLCLSAMGCGRSERMDLVYAQRCVSCHGSNGRGDGQIAASLPLPVPDFRETVERKSNGQMRRIISEGKGVMPAFDPALSPGEINDMVRMVRLLSRDGRDISWWEKYDALVIAHCSVPWDTVFGYDQPPEDGKRENR